MASWQLLDGLHRSVAPIPTALRVSLSTVARFDCWGRGMPRLQLAFYCSAESLSAVTEKGGGGRMTRQSMEEKWDIARRWKDHRCCPDCHAGVFFFSGVGQWFAGIRIRAKSRTRTRKWDTGLLIPKGLELFWERTETADRYGQTKGSNHLYKKERNEKVRPRKVEILKKKIRERFCTYTLCLYIRDLPSLFIYYAFPFCPETLLSWTVVRLVLNAVF